MDKDTPKLGIDRRGFLAASAVVAVAATAGQAGAAVPNGDLLISGARIATFDEKRSIIDDGAIAVSGGKITWMGPRAQAAQSGGTTVIDGTGLIAMPGLTNTHFNGSRFLLQGARSQGVLHVGNAETRIAGFEAAISPEEVYASGMAAFMASIRAGITCVLDAGGPHPDQLARAAKDVGIRARLALGVCDLDREKDLPKGYISSTADALSRSEAFVRQYKGDDRVGAWLAVRSVLQSSEALRRGMGDLSKQFDVPIHMRVGTTPAENDFIVERYNKRPLAHLGDLGLLTERLHLAGTALISPQEIALLGKNKVSAAHAPFSDYRVGAYRYLEMTRQNMVAGLASDGPMPGGPIDLFEAARMAALGQAMFYGMPDYRPEVISEEDVLHAGVNNGAAAARLAGTTGILKVGMAADIILLDVNDAARQPPMDTMRIIAQRANAGNVHTTIVAGNVLMQDRKFKSIDEKTIRARIDSSYRSLFGRLGYKAA
jgi:5-methylthioadenosine/S-adenosylhomocysteine deaminase